jgi:hypothetical protein
VVIDVGLGIVNSSPEVYLTLTKGKCQLLYNRRLIVDRLVTAETILYYGRWVSLEGKHMPNETQSQPTITMVCQVNDLNVRSSKDTSTGIA